MSAVAPFATDRWSQVTAEAAIAHEAEAGPVTPVTDRPPGSPPSGTDTDRLARLPPLAVTCTVAVAWSPGTTSARSALIATLRANGTLRLNGAMVTSFAPQPGMPSRSTQPPET